MVWAGMHLFWFLLLCASVQAALNWSSELGGECKWADFQLIRVLGKGGHGFVTKAFHKPSGRSLALKILSGDKETSQDLKRESSIHASMNHPDISRFFCYIEAGSDGSIDGRSFKRGDPVFVLELVQGGSLRDIMKRGKAFNPKVITRQLVSVIGYLRKNNIVFGDLSSGNVMITDHGNVKLIDFGAALNVEPSRQEPSPVFVSYKTRPHRWQNFAADWYSLGLLIEEMLVCQENGAWRDQRNLRNKKCSDLIKTSNVCDLVQHLIPRSKDWRSIWGITQESEELVRRHKWLM